MAKSDRLLGISEKASIKLGTSTGSLKFQKAISTGSQGSARFTAAENAVIIATSNGANTKLPASIGFGAIGSDGQAAGEITLVGSNTTGTWTLADLATGLFAAKGVVDNDAAQLYAVINYATVLTE
jgi:hypothetical protein